MPSAGNKRKSEVGKSREKKTNKISPKNLTHVQVHTITSHRTGLSMR